MFGYIIFKLFKGIDIREYGSKNVGLINVLCVLGVKYGIFIFLLDCFKGVLLIIIIRYMLGMLELFLILDIYDIFIVFGVVVVIGYIKFIYIGFKGGKVVVIGVGVVIVINLIIGLSGIGLFFIVVFLIKYVLIGLVVVLFFVVVMMWIGVLIKEIWIFVLNLMIFYEL